MGDNGVSWETVDYGEASFHIVSYRREDPENAARPEPPAAVEEVPDPCPIANWLFFRCWTAGRSSHRA